MAEPRDAAARWGRSTSVLTRRVARSLVLTHGGGGEPVVVNASGAIVWDLLDDPATAVELADTIATASGADHATVARQVADVLTDLADRGLVLEHP